VYGGQASVVMTALLQYVKAEQKDRVHTINHYEHVEQADPVEAETQRSTVAAHLRGIDERVTQAIDMLARLPRFQRKIRTQIGQSALSSQHAICSNKKSQSTSLRESASFNPSSAKIR